MDKPNKEKGYPLAILLLAVAIVFALSYVHWSEFTGNVVKDYDLLADLWPADSVAKPVASNEVVDPELLVAIAESKADSVATASEADTVAAAPVDHKALAEFNPRVDGKVVIEDYTADHSDLDRFRQALASGKKLRVAVVGDSYIEGDILTQDVRQQLQAQGGGRGVGYMPAHSQVAGFRQTVRQSDSGWKQHGMSSGGKNTYYNLAGEYFTAAGHATITFKGNTHDLRLSHWERSLILFIAPAAGTITVTTDAGPVECEIGPSDEVQNIVVEGETSMLKLDCNVPGLVFLGAWLEDNSGVVVDCMSIRGDSGITHRRISPELAQQMRKYVDYDLIILEYGINALTADQFNYENYGRMMQQVVERVRECYPGAAILLMGIGDRGQKVGGEIRSLPSAPYMVAAQRKAAQNAHCLFWDTREAMGGNDAVVEWRQKKLVNGDYIHLNSAGGRALATLLVDALTGE